MTAPPDRTEEIHRLVERRERNPRTHTFAELADLYRQAGELNRALEVIEDGLLHHPHFLNARLVYARVLRELERSEDSAHAFRKVLEIDSQNETALAALSELGQGVVDITPTDGTIHLSAASAPRSARWLAGLDADWRHGSRVDQPAAAAEESTETRGIVVQSDDKGDEAAAATPDRTAGEDLETATLANLYLAQGLTEQAIGIYERLLARDPYNARLAAALEEVRQRGRSPSAPVARPTRPPVPRPDVPPEPEPEALDASAPPDTSVGEFLEQLLEGRAAVEPPGGDQIDWPQWLRDLGTRR